mgnify:CR=1 FL=1
MGCKELADKMVSPIEKISASVLSLLSMAPNFNLVISSGAR